MIMNRFLTLIYLLFHWCIPLSIAQQKMDTLPQTIKLVNPSFENLNLDNNLPSGWKSCTFANESHLFMQPGRLGCVLLPQSGKQYIAMVARDNNTYQAISQVLSSPLKAGVCYRMSVLLAKTSTYASFSRTTGNPANYNRPLKLMIWGIDTKSADQCKANPADWLSETLPVHNDGWRKYTFYIQPPKDVQVLMFSVNHVVDKPYNGNLLIDNISLIEPISCTDFQRINGGQKGAYLTLQEVSDVITTNAPKLMFGEKKIKLPLDTEGGRNKALDQILAYFEKSESYKLIIRVKKGKDLSKQRIAFLYNYIFKNTSLKAQRVEIKPFTAKDEAFFWTFENEEIALSFDSM
jgi:hypothetical protein